MNDPLNPPPVKPAGPSGEKIATEAKDLKAEAQQLKQDAREKAAKAYEDTKQGARQALKDTASYANNVVADQKSALVNKFDEYKGAILAASEKLDSENDSVAAGKIRKVAGGLDNLSGYLRDTDPSDLYDEAGRLARKHPEIVFGGLFVAGLGLARFLKSSADERSRDQRSSGNSHTPPAPVAVHHNLPNS